MIRHTTLARITDLSIYGSYYMYATAIVLIGAGAGGLIDWAISGDPAIGIALGVLTGFLFWLGLIIWARAKLQEYVGRRRAHDDP